VRFSLFGRLEKRVEVRFLLIYIVNRDSKFIVKMFAFRLLFFCLSTHSNVRLLDFYIVTCG
jgi:hypothetical protein